MKKFLLASILFITVVNADYIKWYSDYDRGHKESLKENKNIMLFLSDDSIESKKMFKETFLNKNLIKFINKNYVSIHLPFGTDQFPLELYYTLDAPSLFFATNYEIIIGEKITGHISGVKLLKLLKKNKDLDNE